MGLLCLYTYHPTTWLRPELRTRASFRVCWVYIKSEFSALMES